MKYKYERPLAKVVEISLGGAMMLVDSPVESYHFVDFEHALGDEDFN